MEALLAGDFDDDDDDDDESFDEGNGQDDDDDDDDDDNEDEEEGGGSTRAAYSRLPLHELGCAGKVESLTAVLAEGASTGHITIGQLPDGTPLDVPDATAE